MDTICVTEGILGLAFCSVLLAGCSSPSPSTKAMATGPSPLASPTKVHAYLNLAYDRLPESRLHLFVPDGTSRAPLVVLIHGGGWNGGTLDQYDAHCVRLASEGLAAATIEYRFLDQVPMPEIVADVARACAFLAANGREYGYDGSRMFLMGSSAGGHLALVVAARRNSQRNCT
jgi:pectinesterase